MTLADCLAVAGAITWLLVAGAFVLGALLGLAASRRR
jgi:hypothetical protein